MGYRCSNCRAPPSAPALALVLGCLLVHLRSSWALPSGVTHGKHPVNVLVLLPGDTSYLFSYKRLMPALDIAIETIKVNASMLPHHQFNVQYEDSKCDERIPMNAAINYYIQKKVDIFLGPVCDYSVAPIIRQTTFWNIPMISIGANARDFITKRKSMYPLLTRVGPIHHSSMVDFFVKQMELRDWTKIKLFYSRSGQDDLVIDFCHFTTESIVYGLKQTAGSKKTLDVSFTKLEPNSDLSKILLNDVSRDWAGGEKELTSTTDSQCSSLGENSCNKVF
ncbi:atrial natriuretic peptide receptor 3 [Biomphalaria glabrata]|nr:atrial natriuretic peptide receptor 3 [Biomphalaria glabrata]